MTEKKITPDEATAIRFKLISILIFIVWLHLFFCHACESLKNSNRHDRIEQKIDTLISDIPSQGGDKEREDV